MDLKINLKLIQKQWSESTNKSGRI
jgi:hypothetical protein